MRRMGSVLGWRRWIPLLPAFALLAAVPPAAVAEDDGKAFVPRPVSQKIYAIAGAGGQIFECPHPDGPSPPCEGERFSVDSSDGITALSLQIWQPAARPGGPQPPAKVPTIVDFDYYHPDDDSPRVYVRESIRSFVPRGYAFVLVRVRGRTPSGGCFQNRGPLEDRDSADVIDWLVDPGNDVSPYNGRLATIGESYSGGTAIGAATRARPELVDAVIAAAPLISGYEYTHMDGVAYTGSPQYYGSGELTRAGEWVSGEDPASHSTARSSCTSDHIVAASEPTGSVVPYHRERDMRVDLAKLKAATLIAQGHADWNVFPGQQAGFFDRIPAGTPKAGVFGLFAHAKPDDIDASALPEDVDRNGVSEVRAREDWEDMQVAWLDRYLKGLDSGVESWPAAQVQSNDGQWHADPDWPSGGGPVGHLALSSAGLLGADKPEPGDLPTSYVEAGPELTPADTSAMPPGSYVTFETEDLTERLEITGQPVLDLWVSLDRPDAHIAARIETFDADGNPLGVQRRNWDSTWYDTGTTIGFRSAQHLDPLTEGRFWQAGPSLPETLRAIRVPVRLQPVDLVVPKGGRIRITVAGSLKSRTGLEEDPYASVMEDPSAPSGMGTLVTILHDCEHMSALRFRMPSPRRRSIDVKDYEASYKELGDGTTPKVTSDGGLATAPVCGQAPARPEL